MGAKDAIVIPQGVDPEIMSVQVDEASIAHTPFVVADLEESAINLSILDEPMQAPETLID